MEHNWNKDEAEELLIIYFNNLITGGILKIFKNNLEQLHKEKIFKDLRLSSIRMLNGYKKKNFKRMVLGMGKLCEIYSYVNSIYMERETDAK